MTVDLVGRIGEEEDRRKEVELELEEALDVIEKYLREEWGAFQGAIRNEENLWQQGADLCSWEEPLFAILRRHGRF